MAKREKKNNHKSLKVELQKKKNNGKFLINYQN